MVDETNSLRRPALCFMVAEAPMTQPGRAGCTAVTGGNPAEATASIWLNNRVQRVRSGEG